MHLQGQIIKPNKVSWKVKWSKTSGMREVKLRCECHLPTKGRDTKEYQ